MAVIDRTTAAQDAARRLDRTIAIETPNRWMNRLKDDDAAVRFATAKGTWKLQNIVIVDALLVALEREKDPEVRIAMAVNLLAASNDLPLSPPTALRVHAQAQQAMRDPELRDPAEQRAIQQLFEGHANGSGVPPDALDALRRFWAE